MRAPGFLEALPVQSLYGLTSPLVWPPVTRAVFLLARDDGVHDRVALDREVGRLDGGGVDAVGHAIVALVLEAHRDPGAVRVLAHTGLVGDAGARAFVAIHLRAGVVDVEGERLLATLVLVAVRGDGVAYAVDRGHLPVVAAEHVAHEVHVQGVLDALPLLGPAVVADGAVVGVIAPFGALVVGQTDIAFAHVGHQR